ncbi:MAG: PspC domain-containing protein [Dermatophilaceae bacterium]
MSELTTAQARPAATPGQPGGVASVRRMYRPQTERQVAGVAAGLAVHLGLPVRWVRVAFVVSLLVTGMGLPVYLSLWALTPAGYEIDPATGTAREILTEGAGATRRGRLTWQVALIVVGLMLLLSGPILSGATVWGLSPVTALAVVALVAGAVIAWSHLDDTDRRAWLGLGGGSRGAVLRVVVGAVLGAVGAVVLVTRGAGATVMGDVLVATLAVLAGLALILAPWGLRFWRRFQAEQARGIREAERADIAAHLHDSVLQTLALIQRTEDPGRVAQLARSQERELRTWLYGRGGAATDSLATAAADAAAEVEELHGVPVDLVVTGDRPLCEHTDALVRALRESLLNAVRHGAPPVTAYVEVQPRRVEAFVRDHGPGFDVEEIADDRMGVRESILGRMERAGGHARIRRLDSGTEVVLELPVEPPESAAGPDRLAGGPGRETRAAPPVPDGTDHPNSTDRAQEAPVER